MSRVYEAVQRADRERNAAEETEGRHLAETMIVPCVGTPQLVNVDVDLGRIARHLWKPSGASLPALGNRGAGIEQFRGLRSRIDQLRMEAPLKTILVSSGMPAEGKTFVAANLALSLARNAVNNILLIDGDLRRGTLHNLLGAPNAPGLAEYLAGAADLTAIMQQCATTEKANAGAASSISRVTFIPSGVYNDGSSELVASHRMENLVAILSPHFDWIVIDSPPVLAVTDAVELARAADAVLLVARGANTSFEVAQRAQSAFCTSRILGFVLNAVKDVSRNKSYSYYYGREEGGQR
jgi:protein-tyrosine kinase